MCHALVLFLVFCLPWFAGPANAAESQWPVVAPVDFSQINADSFSDEELEIPEKLFHFAQVANAVVEKGDNRGFLDLPVNRDPQDNQPYNARILEMQMVLAYFYTIDRPWNPYRGDAAVRVRLEAMLDRWIRIQNPDGLFAEYSEENFSLAPTGFGALAVARTLDLLKNNGQPFSEQLLERARLALRKSLVALFTNPMLLKAARQYSNQHSGSYYAAAAYLANWPDSELHDLLVAAVTSAVENDQSPAGFFYERSGPDFGYSGVHDENVRIAWPIVRNDERIEPLLLKSDTLWNEWLSYNYAPIPGTPDFLVNAGVQSRTTFALAKPTTRVLAEFVTASRALALTDEEYRLEAQKKRRELAQQWGKWPTLKVPNPYSYRPDFVHTAAGERNPWHPTSGQRETALAAWPMARQGNLTHQRHDRFPYTYTYIKRPGYYAAFNSGRITPTAGEHRQAYGLGLLWNPGFGPALQSVSESPWFWGTLLPGDKLPVEALDLFARFSVNGQEITPTTGARDLPEGDLQVTYPLPDNGRKTLLFSKDEIQVTVEKAGPFQEVLPLVIQPDAKIQPALGELVVSQNGLSLRVESPGAMLDLQPSEDRVGDLIRRKLVIRGQDQLAYRIHFSSLAPQAPEKPKE